MNRTYKIITAISLCAVLIFCICTFSITAFAQDPFTGIAIGGLGGASGAGLFGSMAAASGVNIEYTSDPVNDAMWNKLIAVIILYVLFIPYTFLYHGAGGMKPTPLDRRKSMTYLSRARKSTLPYWLK